jgi:hypothetical protein
MNSYESGQEKVLLLSAGILDELCQTYIVETHDVADAVGLVQSTSCIGDYTLSDLLLNSLITVIIPIIVSTPSNLQTRVANVTRSIV